MKKALLLLLALTMVLPLAACSSGGAASGDVGDDGKPIYELRCAGIYAPDYPITASLEAAAAKIEEKTDGHVKIKVYPANQLGDGVQQYEEVIKGTIDMASCALPCQFDKRMEVTAFPYLVTSYENAKYVFAEGSAYYDFVRRINDDADVDLLNLYVDGFMGIGGVDMSTDNIMDPTIKKDALMRCPGMASYIAVADGLGYPSTTIPYADLYPAMQTGVCDGWVGGTPFLNNEAYADVIKTYIDYRYICEIQGTFINKELLASMPQEYQDIIRDTFREEAATLLDNRETMDQEAMQAMADKGINVIVPTDDEFATIVEHFKANVWPDLIDAIGTDEMDVVLADLEAK